MADDPPFYARNQQATTRQLIVGTHVAPAFAPFWRLACRKAVQLLLDLRDAGQLCSEFVNDVLDLCGESPNFFLRWWSRWTGSPTWASGTARCFSGVSFRGHPLLSELGGEVYRKQAASVERVD